MAKIIDSDGVTGIPQTAPNLRLVIPTLNKSLVSGVAVGQVVIDTGVLYYWNGTAWKQITIEV